MRLRRFAVLALALVFALGAIVVSSPSADAQAGVVLITCEMDDGTIAFFVAKGRGALRSALSDEHMARWLEP